MIDDKMKIIFVFCGYRQWWTGLTGQNACVCVFTHVLLLVQRHLHLSKAVPERITAAQQGYRISEAPSEYFHFGEHFNNLCSVVHRMQEVSDASPRPIVSSGLRPVTPKSWTSCLEWIRSHRRSRHTSEGH